MQQIQTIPKPGGPNHFGLVHIIGNRYLVGDVVRVEHSLCESTGCTDPAATNYDRSAGSYDHSCQYTATGAVDFTHGRTGSTLSPGQNNRTRFLAAPSHHRIASQQLLCAAC